MIHLDYSIDQHSTVAFLNCVHLKWVRGWVSCEFVNIKFGSSWHNDVFTLANADSRRFTWYSLLGLLLFGFFPPLIAFGRFTSQHGSPEIHWGRVAPTKIAEHRRIRCARSIWRPSSGLSPWFPRSRCQMAQRLAKNGSRWAFLLVKIHGHWFVNELGMPIYLPSQLLN